MHWCAFDAVKPDILGTAHTPTAQARDQLADPNFFGTMMVASGDADGMVSGACHSTAATIRPGLQVPARPPCAHNDYVTSLP